MSPERFSTRQHVHHHHLVQVIKNPLRGDEVQKVILLYCERDQGGASKAMVSDRMTLREFGLEPVRSGYLMDLCLVRVILMT